jgi:type II secretory ATPase GspE/PulE/Tfp pilus assembly ATPase PilB-like protein
MSIADVAPIAAAQAPLNGPVDQRFIELIAHATARKHLLLAVRPSQDRLTMLSAQPLPAWLRLNLSRLVGSFQESLIPADILAKRIDEAFAAIDSAADDQQPATVVSAVNGPADVPDDHDLLSTHSTALAVRLLDSIIFHAISQHASDIHLQPLAGQLLVRYRVDGVLITVRTLARALSEPLISRLKVMARMDVAEKRLPQDGRCSVLLSSVTQGLGRKIDLRIGTLPTTAGGLRSLREAGQELIDQGLTRLDEILRVTAGASS